MAKRNAVAVETETVEAAPVAEKETEKATVTGTEFPTEAAFRKAIAGLSPEEKKLATEDRSKGPEAGTGGRVGGLCVRCRRYAKKGTVVCSRCLEAAEEAEAAPVAVAPKAAPKARRTAPKAAPVATA